MKKSLLSLALAGSMLSALAVPAFAATPSDVVGKPVQNAVEALTALGIINGYADGTFKPENTITRAELAKIVIVATGNQSAANLMANTAPSFKDVKKGAWYTGYINAAAAKGFIQGYNGKFRPNDPIKFEEVTAILVRALGYKDKYLSGSWPYNVLLQADEVGLFEGLEMANGTNATRGTVAELAENALGANLVKYDADGNVSNVTVLDDKGTAVTTDDVQVPQLLINKLGTSSTAVVTSTSLNSDKQITLSSGTFDTAANFFITGGKKLSDLLGHSVTVLKNKDGDVLAITDAQDAANILTVTSDAIADLPTLAADANFVYNDGAGSKKLAAGFTVFNNTDRKVAATPATDSYDLANGEEVQLFLDGNGKIQAVLVNDWDANLVLDTVSAYNGYSRITTKNGGSSKVDANTSITLDGKVATLADLKQNDVINVIENASDVAVKIVATRNTVTGKLESTGKVDSDITYTVGGKTYVAKGTAITPANLLDSGDIGTEYTFSLNKDGHIVYYTTASGVTSGSYAVVYSVETGKSIIVDGEVQNGWTKVVYYSLKDQKVNTVYTKDADVDADLTNQLIELKFDSDGRIALTTDESNAGTTLTAAGATAGTVDADPTATKLVVKKGTATTNYITSANTIYLKVGINATDSSKNTVTAATAADVSKGDSVVVRASNGNASYVIITSDSSAAALPKVQGLFISQSEVTTADGTTYTVKLKVNGEEKTYTVDAAITANKNDLVTLTDDAAANNTVYENQAVVAQTAVATSLTANSDAGTITVNGPATYLVTSNTQVVVLNKEDGSINEGDFNDLRAAADTGNYGTADGQYQVVVLASGDTYGSLNEAGVVLVIAY